MIDGRDGEFNIVASPATENKLRIIGPSSCETQVSIPWVEGLSSIMMSHLVAKTVAKLVIGGWVLSIRILVEPPMTLCHLTADKDGIETIVDYTILGEGAVIRQGCLHF